MSDSKQSIAEVIEIAGERFNQIAPKAMNYEAEKGFAIQLLKNSPYLMKVAVGSPQSLQQAITNVAAIGLSLNPAEKLAYLIPRNLKVGDNKWENRIFLEPSYMGLIRLATNSGSIKWIQAACVYKEDSYIDNGLGSKPDHTFSPFATLEERGDFVGVYAVAKTKDGDYLSATMNAERVYEIRGRSESYKKHQKGTWVDDFVEMSKKAAIRLLFKTLPRTDENARFAAAVDISNLNEGFEPIVNNPDVSEFTADQKNHLDYLIEKNDALGMIVFQKTLDVSIYTGLYHSFEKGTKGKYQKIIDTLAKDGLAKAQTIADQLLAYVEEDDNDGVLEIISELNDGEVDYVLSITPSEIASAVRKMMNEVER